MYSFLGVVRRVRVHPTKNPWKRSGEDTSTEWRYPLEGGSWHAGHAEVDGCEGEEEEEDED